MTFEELAKKNIELKFYGMEDNFFKLDDNIYQAIENPDDGYRSFFQEIKSVTEEEADNNLIFFQNPIDTVLIVQVSLNNFEGYEIISVEDEHVWIKVGTDKFDSYYPICVIEYKPRYQ